MDWMHIGILTVADLVLFLVVGWLAHGWWRRQRAQRTGGDLKEEAAHKVEKSAPAVIGSAGTQCQQTLSGVDSGLDEYADKLAEFQAALRDVSVLLPIVADSQREYTGRISVANRNVMLLMRSNGALLDGLTGGNHEPTRTVTEHMAGFGRQVKLFDHALHSDLTLASSQTLLEQARGLRKANRKLKRELADKGQLIALQSDNLTAEQLNSRIDPLTRLANRRAFEEKIAGLQAIHERYGQTYTMALYAIDHLENIDEIYGEAVGKDIMAQIGSILRHNVRGTNHVSRFSREMIALLLPLAKFEVAWDMVDRYRDRIEQASLATDGPPIEFTVSAGVAELRDGELPEELIRRVDEALYAAQVSGGNQVFVHDGQEVYSATAVET